MRLRLALNHRAVRRTLLLAILIASVALVLSIFGMHASVGWHTRSWYASIGVEHGAAVAKWDFELDRQYEAGRPTGLHVFPMASPLEMARHFCRGVHWGGNGASVPLWMFVSALLPLVLVVWAHRYRHNALSQRIRGPRARRLWTLARQATLWFALLATLAACGMLFGLIAVVGVETGFAHIALFDDKSHWTMSSGGGANEFPHQVTVFPWNRVEEVLQGWGILTPATSWHKSFSLPSWLPILLFSSVYFLVYRYAPRFKPTQCQACGYDLAGLSAGVCPECGTASQAEASAEPPRSRGGAPEAQ